MGSITKAAVRLAENEMAQSEAAFANLKDPVHRWFFGETGSGSSSFSNTLSELTPYQATDSTVDSKYTKRIKQIGQKKTSEKKKRTKQEETQQVATNQLQYQLSSASNPYDSNSKKKNKRKRSRRKKSKS
jgi:hypothetical protein